MADTSDGSLAASLALVLMTLLQTSTSAALYSHQRYLEGRLLPQESYIVAGDLMIGATLPISLRSRSGDLCGSRVRVSSFEIMYGYRYAIELINRNSSLLPGTRLGVYVLDDCGRMGLSSMRILQAISHPHEGPIPTPLSLNITTTVLGILGPATGPMAAAVGHAARIYTVPLIVPLSSDPSLANRGDYPTVWSPAPTILVYPGIMLRLIEHFSWNYFAVLYSDMGWGIQSYKDIHARASQLEICVAEAIMFYADMDFVEAARRILASRAEVLVALVVNTDLQRLFAAFSELGVEPRFHLIMTHQANVALVAPWRHMFLGSVRLRYKEYLDPDLWSYLANVWPGDEAHNPWLQRHWVHHGWETRCNSSSPTCYNLTHVIGLSRATLLSRPVNAMYALAQAIHNAIERKCPDAFGNMERIMACVTPSDVNDEVARVRVRAPTREFSFNREGDANVTFEILQEQGSFHRLIGEFDMSSDTLHIDNSALDWGPYNWTYRDEVPFPYHRCSAPCPIAHFKVPGDQFCCWKCFACRNNEILVHNVTSCDVCPDKQWPVDAHQLECAAIPHTFLTLENLYGAILAGLSGLGLLLTLIITVTTVRQRNLRVVKGSGLQTLLVILAGIYLAFATVFAHIEKPMDGLCIFGRAGFQFSFTLIFGPMLVKTNRIFQVFFASSKLSTKVFMGSEFSQHVALSVIIIAQVGLTVLSLILWPARATDWMPALTDKYVELYCDVPMMSLVVGTSFNLLLITACSVFAFIARGLPDNFNESWYIFLCVVTTLFIWIAFFTTYISVFYVVYKAALLAAALILNSLVVVFAFFGPKIYAIAFIADKEIKITNFQGSMSYGGGQS